MLDRNYFLTQLVCKFVMKCGKKNTDEYICCVA